MFGYTNTYGRIMGFYDVGFCDFQHRPVDLYGGEVRSGLDGCGCVLCIDLPIERIIDYLSQNTRHAGFGFRYCWRAYIDVAGSIDPVFK